MGLIAVHAVEFAVGALVVVFLVSQVLVPLAFRQPIFPLFRNAAREHERELVRLEAERAKVVSDIEKARLQKEIDALRAQVPPKPPAPPAA